MEIEQPNRKTAIVEFPPGLAAVQVVLLAYRQIGLDELERFVRPCARELPICLGKILPYRRIP